MGGLRITQRLLIDRVLGDLRFQTRELLKLQDQLATGQRINSPSDDPIDARRSINTRTVIQKQEQYLDNIAMMRPQLEETSTLIQAVVDTIQRANELTLQGANGTNSQEQLDYIAEEINELLEQVLTNGNHLSNGRHIFAGTRTLAPAYVATRNVNGDIISVAYQGNDEVIDMAISDNVRVPINEPGSQVFDGTRDVFQLLIDIRDDLLAGDQGSLGNQRLTELEEARQQLSQALARVGAVQNRIQRAENETEDFRLQNQILFSQIVDADFAETIVELNAQQNAYQAALGAAGRVLQPTLLDFVR